MHVAPDADGPVAIRPWSDDDAAWFVAARDEVIYAFTTERPTLGVDELRAAIAASSASPTSAAWAITVDGAPAGSLAIELEDATADLSYWVAAEARGRGVASSAVKLAVAWCRRHGIDVVRAEVMVENGASAQVLRNNGFVRSGARLHHEQLGDVDRFVLVLRG